ncbi:907_t:CDS:2 [Cetraspora pellucida]|uniref:907_t:CDS:1 n=1 Tax=Cetraspora pellucida TaxID=1433469 RepID=A0A9N9IRM1_9GLOM|nr:907_t:CDS:2 [Cetraspora pellucida]
MKSFIYVLFFFFTMQTYALRYCEYFDNNKLILFTINEKKVIISYNDVINETIIENFIERTNIYNDNIEKILIYNDAYIEQYEDIPLDLDSYKIGITDNTIFFVLFLFALFFSSSDSARTKQSIRHKNPTTKKNTKNKQRTGKSKQESKRKSKTVKDKDPVPYVRPGMVLDNLVT